MKKIKTSLRKIIFYTLLLPLLIGCEKENDHLITEENLQTSDLKLEASSRVSNMIFSIKNGMLVFKDLDELKQTLTILEEEVDAYDNTFLEMNSHLEPEQLEIKEEEINYDEYTPLRVFIQNNNLNALFLKQAIAEEQWLSQEKLDITTDPDNHFVEDKALQTLVNEFSEVQIGSAIYKMLEFGYVIITDGSMETLQQIRKNPSFLNYDNVMVFGEPEGATKAVGCKSSKGKSGFKSSGVWRIKWKISHRTPISGRRVKATTINYKKKKKNGWKKTRYYTLVKPYGHISDVPGNCDKMLNFNPSNLYSDRYNKKSWSWKVNVATKTKSGWVKGYHVGAGGISHYSTLTW